MLKMERMIAVFFSLPTYGEKWAIHGSWQGLLVTTIEEAKNFNVHIPVRIA